MKSKKGTGIDEAGKVPNAFYCTQSVTIRMPVGDVYSFIVEDVPTPFASGRDSFEIAEAGGGLVVDSAKGPPEAADDQGMQGRVELTRVPNKQVCASFYPTGGDFLARFVRRMSAYYDLEKVGFSETRLVMTQVIQVSNPFLKLLGMIIGLKRMMASELTKELDELKSDIEKGDAGTGESPDAQLTEDIDAVKSQAEKKLTALRK